MCGITGIFNLNGKGISKSTLAAMTDMISHRGPDDEGLFVDGNIGLGHRRLAIIDLTTSSHQPMISPDGRFALSYNGEVYNFRELRDELKKKGHVFRSDGDAEVVLHSLIEWGREALLKFNGMFALAIWDCKERTLLLARDRYGIKPLYYTQIGSTFLFGSEIKSMLPHPDYSVKMDTRALVEYLTFQNYFTDRTLFENVAMIPAGSSLLLKQGDGALPSPTAYWDFDFREPANPASEEEYAKELDRLFRQAVKRQLVSDVPVSSYLSGGLDTGAITAIASQQNRNMRSFTVGFDLRSASGIELNFDERENAEYMSYLFGTEHYEVVLKAGDMERSLPDLVWHLEEPRVGQCYPNFYAAKLASKFDKVVLSGVGADELFGGYPWRYFCPEGEEPFRDYIDTYYGYWQRLISNSELKNVLSPVWDDAQDVWTRDIFCNVFRTHADELTRPEDYINHSLYLEGKTFLHGLLVVEDKLSMAHQMESRVPFLDNDLVDFAVRLPVATKVQMQHNNQNFDENTPGSKVNRYYDKTGDGKKILRRVLSEWIPDELVNQKKQGFSGPDASWFRGESIDYVKDHLFASDCVLYDFLDRKSTHRLVQEHLSGKKNSRLLIWSLLNLEQWIKTFLEYSPPSISKELH